MKQSPVEKLIKASGNNIPELAKILGLDRTTIWKWQRTRKNGLTGSVPQAQQASILKAAKKHGWKFTAEDLIG